MSLKTVGLENFYRLFYPVVPIVVTASNGSINGGMAAISYLPLSFRPPRVGVSLSPGHSTYDLVKDSREFALNWVDSALDEKVDFMGKVSGKTVSEKLSRSGFNLTEAKMIKAPVLNDAKAILECSLADIHQFGDHDLFVGDVLIAYATEDFDDYWKFFSYSPILYVGSGMEVHGKRKFALLKTQSKD
ncbi:MAG: flavin reductase family protein [Candidatus Bathyarchaeia archaeon]